MDQCPCGTPRFEEDVVDFVPWRLDGNLVGLWLGCLGGGITGETFVDTRIRNAITEPVSQASQPFFDLGKPLAEVIRAGIKLRLGVVGSGEAVAVPAEALDCFAVPGFGPRQNPGIAVEKEIRFGFREVRIFTRL